MSVKSNEIESVSITPKGVEVVWKDGSTTNTKVEEKELEEGVSKPQLLQE